ncbi:MAG: NAD-dependent succinate-semialdehyde dehydrogenase [Mycobacterium sp.]
MTLTEPMTTTAQDLNDFLAALAPHQALRIGGVRRASSNQATFSLTDPSTGTEICAVASATPEDAVAAVDAAQRAFLPWSQLAPRKRSDVLRRAYELIVERVELLAKLISWENGKSLADARGEVLYSAEFFRWYAEEAVRSEGSYGESPAGGTRTIVTHKPVGVAALVTPWNFPAAMAARKLAPALAAGCTTVLKPASETPLTALAIADILEEAGAIAGTVNVVPSRRSAEIAETLLSDPRVQKISFTGSTGVGSTLLAQAARRIVNTSMELGGNAPFIVTDDADIDAAVEGALIAKLRNGGQACTAANRFYVHAAVANEFTEKIGARIEALRVGDPLNESTDIGPLINDRAVKTITALIDGALAGGAKITHQAQIPETGAGSYLAPTVLTDVPADSALVTSEIFGPVTPVVTWREDSEVLAMANASEFGLAAYVYSQDLKRALKIAEGLDSGMVGINRGLISDPAAPFGGFKQSGIGREGAREGIREYLETQYFSVDWS